MVRGSLADRGNVERDAWPDCCACLSLRACQWRTFFRVTLLPVVGKLRELRRAASRVSEPDLIVRRVGANVHDRPQAVQQEQLNHANDSVHRRTDFVAVAGGGK